MEINICTYCGKLKSFTEMKELIFYAGTTNRMKYKVCDDCMYTIHKNSKITDTHNENIHKIYKFLEPLE